MVAEAELDLQALYREVEAPPLRGVAPHLQVGQAVCVLHPELDTEVKAERALVFWVQRD